MVNIDNCESMSYHAGERFLACPFCGFTDGLTIKRTSKYNQVLQTMEYDYEIHCNDCNLTLGGGSFGTESELLANWNRRKY